MANINDRIDGQEYESASPLAHAVRYDRAQVKTEEQKKQARENIGCFCEAGGGGGGSSGGETFVVELEPVDDKQKFNKTAKEVFDACQTSNVIFVETGTETEDGIEITVTSIYSLSGIQYVTDGTNGAYTFVLIGSDVQGKRSTYSCYDDNDYPTNGDK